jgi:hypothetical protein
MPHTAIRPPWRICSSTAVEVDVDAVGKTPLERGAEVGLGLVVERVVEAELGLQETDLLVGAGAADHVATGDLGKLPDGA